MVGVDESPRLAKTSMDYEMVSFGVQLGVQLGERTLDGMVERYSWCTPRYTR